MSIYYCLGDIMEISILLIKQIIQMFIMVIFGYLVVKGKILKTPDSKVVSALLLYVIIPCSLINSFSIEATPDKMQGLMYSFLAAILVHIVFFYYDENFRECIRVNAHRESFYYLFKCW